MRRLFQKLTSKPESGPIRYLLPFAAMTLVIVIQLVVSVFVPKSVDFPYVFFYLVAVFAVAWIGSYGPGVVACLLTMVGIPLAVLRGDLRQFHVDPSRLILFILVSLLVSAVAESQRRSRALLRQANAELDQRVQERTQELAQSVAALSSEVEQRKKTEEALRDTEGRVDFALNAAGIGRWDVDLQNQKVTRSLHHDQIFGYDSLQPEWNFETTLEHIIEEDRAAAAANFTAAMEGNEPYDFEYRIARRDGAIRWIWARGRKLCDAQGKAIGLLGSIRDITARKSAEQRLQDQLKRLNLLDQITRAIGERQDLRSILQVAIRTLEDSFPIDFGCVCMYDPAVEALTVTCVGAHSETLAHELAMTEQATIRVDQNGLSKCVRGQLVYEHDVSEVQFPFPKRLADGGLRSLVAAPLLVESKVFGILVAARRKPNAFDSGDCEFIRQLSEHVALAANQAQIHSALEQAYNDLRQTQQVVMQQERLRALGQMASGIAHDINNAISPVVLYSDMLLETDATLSARARQYLEVIRRAGDDVAHTVSRMREFYHQSAPQMQLQAVQLNTLVQHVVDLTRARWHDMAQQLGITVKLRTELAPDLPIVAGIESEVREALTNLVLNAVDAMPEGGTLTLRVNTSPASTHGSNKQNVIVEVEDTGIGMDEQTIRRCLEPFFTTKGERGTGLGLAMVYGVMQRHSAEIEVNSTVGKGTTVRLIFPVEPAPENSLAELAAAAALPSRLRILVIDDDPLLIKSLRDTLETDGHAVTTANGGQEGIEVFKASHQQQGFFDIAITDLGMPYVDGRKVASALKAISPVTPVILLTGWGQRLVAEGDLPPYVDRVLSKPPKLRELRMALAELVPGSAVPAAVNVLSR